MSGRSRFLLTRREYADAARLVRVLGDLPAPPLRVAPRRSSRRDLHDQRGDLGSRTGDVPGRAGSTALPATRRRRRRSELRLARVRPSGRLLASGADARRAGYPGVLHAERARARAHPRAGRGDQAAGLGVRRPLAPPECATGPLPRPRERAGAHPRIARSAHCQHGRRAARLAVDLGRRAVFIPPSCWRKLVSTTTATTATTISRT